MSDWDLNTFDRLLLFCFTAIASINFYFVEDNSFLLSFNLIIFIGVAFFWIFLEIMDWRKD